MSASLEDIIDALASRDDTVLTITTNPLSLDLSVVVSQDTKIIYMGILSRRLISSFGYRFELSSLTEALVKKAEEIRARRKEEQGFWSFLLTD